MSVKISPSVLTADFLTLKDDIKKLEAAGTDMLHLDVMDGIFVPNISFGVPVIKSIKKHTSLPLDVHLMIDRPHRYIKQFAEAADILGFHYEAGSDVRATLTEIRERGCRACLTIKPGTAPEEIFEFLPLCDMVLVMSVEPGFGGQKFMADMMPKVAQLRAMLDEVNPDCELEVDGGVDTATRDACVNAGANVLVAGSAVYKAADIPAKIKALREG